MTDDKIINITGMMGSITLARKIRDVCKKIELYKKREVKIAEVFNKFYQRVKVPIYDYIKINKFINKVLEVKK